MKTASWIIRDKKTKEIVAETFSQKIVDALNTKKYEAVPILEYLVSLNKPEHRFSNRGDTRKEILERSKQ